MPEGSHILPASARQDPCPGVVARLSRCQGLYDCQHVEFRLRRWRTLSFPGRLARTIVALLMIVLSVVTCSPTNRHNAGTLPLAQCASGCATERRNMPRRNFQPFSRCPPADNTPTDSRSLWPHSLGRGLEAARGEMCRKWNTHVGHDTSNSRGVSGGHLTIAYKRWCRVAIARTPASTVAPSSLRT